MSLHSSLTYSLVQQEGFSSYQECLGPLLFWHVFPELEFIQDLPSDLEPFRLDPEMGYRVRVLLFQFGKPSNVLRGRIFPFPDVMASPHRNNTHTTMCKFKRKRKNETLIQDIRKTKSLKSSAKCQTPASLESQLCSMKIIAFIGKT